MARWLHELEHGSQRGQQKRPGRQSLQRLAQASLATVGQTQSDVAASTRYSEQDTLDTLLLRRLRFCPEQQLTELTLLDGSCVQLPVQRHKLTPAGWRELSIRLQKQLLGLRPSLAPPACERSRLEKLGLQQVFHLGHPAYEDALLRVALVDDAGCITTLDGQAASGRYEHHYRDDLGYQHVKQKD